MAFLITLYNPSPDMLEKARTKTSLKINLFLGNNSDLSTFEKTNILTCSLALNYLPNLNDFAKNSKSVLSNGGIIVTADLNRPYVASCISSNLIYEKFDSINEPKVGVVNF